MEEEKMIEKDNEPRIYCLYCGEILRILEVLDHVHDDSLYTFGCPKCWNDPKFVGEFVFGHFQVAQ